MNIPAALRGFFSAGKTKTALRYVVILTFLAACLSLLGYIAASWQKPSRPPVLVGDTGWIFAGYYDTDQKAWQGQTYVRLLDPSRDRSENPFAVGDRIEVQQERRVVIVDFKNEGITRKFESPLLAGYDEAKDLTGENLPIGTQLEIRDVSIRGLPNRASACWLRVAYTGTHN